jgi:hypothetical protein
MRQTRKLAVRVVESIGANMEHHPGYVDAQITVEIKMSRDDAKDAASKLRPPESSSAARKTGPAKPYYL